MGMNNNVFQCHGENGDKQQFLKTVGVVGEHVNKTFESPQDVASVCEWFKIVPLIPPANLEKTVLHENDMAHKMIWETKMKGHLKGSDLMESNTWAIYAIVWGQCSPLMRSKLESLLEHYDDSSK